MNSREERVQLPRPQPGGNDQPGRVDRAWAVVRQRGAALAAAAARGLRTLLRQPWTYAGLVILGQVIVNRDEVPFSGTLGFLDSLDRYFRLELPNAQAALTGYVLLAVGAVGFGLCLARHTSESEDGSVRPAPAILRAVWSRHTFLCAASAALLAYVVVSIVDGSSGRWVISAWLGSLPLMGAFWFITDRRRLIPLSLSVSWADLALLVVIVVGGLLLVSYDLQGIPDSLWGDEGWFWEHAKAIAEGVFRPSVFDVGVFTFPVFGSYYQGAVAKAFGTTLWSWRFASVLVAVASLVPLYFLVRELFNRRVALLAAVLVIVCPYFLAFSRLGYNSIQCLLPVTAALLFFYLAWRRQSTFYFFLSGCAMGLGLYVFLAARIALPIVAIFCIYLLVLRKMSFSELMSGLGAAASGFLLLAVPLYVFQALEVPREWLTEKMLESAFFNSFYGRAMFSEVDFDQGVRSAMVGSQEIFFEPLLYFKLLGRGVIRTFLAFNHDGLTTQHYLTSSLAGPVAAVFFMLGLGVCIARWRQSRYLLLLIWFLAGILALSILNTFPPRWTHTLPVIPAMATMAALGIYTLVQTVIRYAPRFASVTVGAAVLLVVAIGVLGVREYFVVSQDIYKPNMENVILWSAFDLESETRLVLVDEERAAQNWMPWGLRQFETKASFEAISQQQLLTDDSLLRSPMPQMFFFYPDDEKAVMRRLQTGIPGSAVVQRYTNTAGEVILVSYLAAGS